MPGFKYLLIHTLIVETKTKTKTLYCSVHSTLYYGVLYLYLRLFVYLLETCYRKSYDIAGDERVASESRKQRRLSICQGLKAG